MADIHAGGIWEMTTRRLVILWMSGLPMLLVLVGPVPICAALSIDPTHIMLASFILWFIGVFSILIHPKTSRIVDDIEREIQICQKQQQIEVSREARNRAGSVN